MFHSVAVRLAHISEPINPFHPIVTIGTVSIDGCLSTVIGQTAVTKRPCFMFAGDLGFFNNMSVLWNRYVGKNVRTLLSNNEDGETFHANNAKGIDTVNLHTAAKHFASAKGWAETRGLNIYCP